MSRVRVSSVTVGQLAVNCWFLINEDTKEALVFDPGDQADKIVQYASERSDERRVGKKCATMCK